MSDSDILLVNASVSDARGSRHARLSPPLGLGYIGAVLEEKGYKVSAIDFNISGFNNSRLSNAISRESPKVIGISAHTKTYVNALEIASTAKDTDPNTIVVMGGPHPTVNYEETAVNENVDFVVRGEGEKTMLELVNSIKRGNEVNDIGGLAYQDDGEVIATAKRDFISEPDELPFPARDLFPLYLYTYPGNVLASRGGCPFQCRFCAVNSIWGEGARRFREPQDIIEEVVHIFRNYKIQQINFSDDTFTLNRGHTMEVIERLANLNPPFPWYWTCSTRADLVDRKLVEAMADAGCSSIQYGAEAGTEETLDVIGKGMSLDQIRNAVEMTLEEGMDVLCSFMYPHPGDTEETIHDQIDFMNELSNMGANLVLSLTTPYPGTYYYENANELGLEIHADSWGKYDGKHLMISTEHLSLDELRNQLERMVEEVNLARSPTQEIGGELHQRKRINEPR